MSAAAAFGASQHAVLLGIDGLSIRALHEALDAGNAPNLKTLREGGIFTDDARSCQPTLSLPNWASTLFSAPPEMHGVRGTTYEENIVRPATLEAGNVWPNLFTVARAKKACSDHWRILFLGTARAAAAATFDELDCASSVPQLR